MVFLKKFLLQLLDREFVRFVLVGLVNTAFSYGVYALFIFLGFHYSLATLFQIVLSTLFNFNTFGKLVFKKSDRWAILRFILVSLTLYLIYTFGIKALRSFRLNDYISGAIMVFPVMMTSFFLNKFFVFRTDGKKGRKNGPGKKKTRKKGKTKR